MQSSARVKVNISGIPLSQNTAPVHEHRALYTHDLRRKAKRWQDGIVKFHTFNNRVMLYDEARNFLGDTYFQEIGREGLEDGDELTLDRAGLLLQVGEKLRSEQTDLTELLAKRAAKTVDNGAVARTSRNIPHQGTTLPNSHNQNVSPRTPAQWGGWGQRTQLLQQSPFEQRVQAAAEGLESLGGRRRPAKRQKRDDEHIPLWEVLKTTRPVLSRPNATNASVPPGLTRVEPYKSNNRPSSANKDSVKKNAQENQGRLKVKEIVDITSSGEENGVGGARRVGIFNSSPTKDVAGFRPSVQGNAAGPNIADPRITIAQDRPRGITRTDSTTAATAIRDRNAQPAMKPVRRQPLSPRRALLPIHRSENHNPPQILHSVQLPSSPPVSTKNHITITADVNAITSANLRPLEQRNPNANDRPPPPVKPLRLPMNLPRNTLLCQTLASAKPKQSAHLDPRVRRRNGSPTETERPSAIEQSAVPVPLPQKRQTSRKQLHVAQQEQELESSPAFEEANPRPTTNLTTATSKAVPDVERRDPTLKNAKDTTKQPDRVDDKLEPPHPESPLAQRVPINIPAQQYHNTPADYGHLDAQLLPHPDPLPATVSLPAVAAEANGTRAGAIVVDGPRAHNAPYRPLRRATSDTSSLSPKKSNGVQETHAVNCGPRPVQPHRPANLNEPDPATKDPNADSGIRAGPARGQAARSRPFRRAETHLGIPSRPPAAPEMTKSNLPQVRPNTTGQGVPDVVAQANDVDLIREKGPWTSEAWALLGWVPTLKVQNAKVRMKKGDDDTNDLDIVTSSPIGLTQEDKHRADGAVKERERTEGWICGLLSRVTVT